MLVAEAVGGVVVGGGGGGGEYQLEVPTFRAMLCYIKSHIMLSSIIIFCFSS